MSANRGWVPATAVTSAVQFGQGAAAAEIVQLEICHERCEVVRGAPGTGSWAYLLFCCES